MAVARTRGTLSMRQGGLKQLHADNVSRFLPPGTSARDFPQAAIQTVHVPEVYTVPGDMLPRNTTCGDFAFTGEKQAEDRAGHIESTATQQSSELVRRMRGAAANSSMHAGGGGGSTIDVADEASLMEDHRIFLGGYNLPDAVRQAAQRGMVSGGSRDAGSSISMSMGSHGKDGGLGGDGYSQYGSSASYHAVARQRREFSKQSLHLMANMTADQRRAYEHELKRRSNEKTAAAARRRRDMARAARVNSLAFQWRPRSPQRVSAAMEQAATPKGSVRVGGGGGGSEECAALPKQRRLSPATDDGGRKEEASPPDQPQHHHQVKPSTVAALGRAHRRRLY